MTMHYSKFGEKFTQNSGITKLMQDLGEAKHSDDPEIIMLGGGNPALIDKAHQVFVDELQQLIADSAMDQVLGYYDGPQGSEVFINTLVAWLNAHYGWSLTKDNIAITNGSQSSLFMLFNLFAGEMKNGTQKKVLLPLVPEYIGYADQGLSEHMFVAIKPRINELDSQQFKYQIDFERLQQVLQDEDIGVICVSRPTNPTGNVITDEELQQLSQLAKVHQVPLIVDNAYGQPFPGVIYTPATLRWDPQSILCMSLSKLGLPGVRSGIVIANENTTQALSRMSGILALAPSGVGPAILTPLIQRQALMPLVSEVIQPFYQARAQTALELFNEVFTGYPVKLHKLEGAFFMWLWFPELSISAQTLYQRLKAQQIYILPGQDFFIGMSESWPHQHQCIRLNYATDEQALRRGLQTIRREVFSV